MELRKLGKSDVSVAPVVFGGNVFGWTVDQTAANRLLDAFVDAGFNAIDTADVYSAWVPGNQGGESETIIGNWQKQSSKRDRVAILTKCGHHGNKDLKGLSRRVIREAVEASLKRLNTDYIDLYQAHIDDANTPLLETLETFAELIREGKVRAIGCSNYSAARLREALDTSLRHGLPRYEALQPRYNMYDREDFERELEQLCLHENVSVIPYYGLASGFLTGKYRTSADFSKSPRGSRMKDFLDARGRRILSALDSVAAAHRTTPASVALAWLIARPSITAPIASATNLDQLKAFTEASRLMLNRDDIEMLNRDSAV